nr:MAG TPA: hypothetical protein [Caudoviricetes sp.]
MKVLVNLLSMIKHYICYQSFLIILLITTNLYKISLKIMRI